VEGKEFVVRPSCLRRGLLVTDEKSREVRLEGGGEVAAMIVGELSGQGCLLSARRAPSPPGGCTEGEIRLAHGVTLRGRMPTGRRQEANSRAGGSPGSQTVPVGLFCCSGRGCVRGASSSFGRPPRTTTSVAASCVTPYRSEAENRCPAASDASRSQILRRMLAS